MQKFMNMFGAPSAAEAPAAEAPKPAAAAGTMLTVGQPAPEFSALTHKDVAVNIGLSPVNSLTNAGNGEYATACLLWFYPRALTGG